MSKLVKSEINQVRKLYLPGVCAEVIIIRGKNVIVGPMKKPSQVYVILHLQVFPGNKKVSSDWVRSPCECEM